MAVCPKRFSFELSPGSCLSEFFFQFDLRFSSIFALMGHFVLESGVPRTQMLVWESGALTAIAGPGEGDHTPPFALTCAGGAVVQESACSCSPGNVLCRQVKRGYRVE